MFFFSFFFSFFFFFLLSFFFLPFSSSSWPPPRPRPCPLPHLIFSFPCTQKKLADTEALLKRLDLLEESVLVDRPELENAVREFCDKPTSDSHYMVVVGPRGSGKSTLVKKALLAVHRAGVVVTKIKTNAIDGLQSRLGVPQAQVTNDPEALAFQIKLAVKDPDVQKALRGKPLVVVVEIDSIVNEQVGLLRSIAQDLKTVGVDNGACRVVLVCSEALSTLALPPDKRQKFLWVDEMSKDEVKTFLDKRGAFMVKTPNDANAAMRARIEQTLPRRPQDLKSLLEEVGTRDPKNTEIFLGLDASKPEVVKKVDDYLAAELNTARTNVDYLLRQQPTLVPLAKLLLKTQEVTALEANELVEGGYNINNIAPIMREHKGIMYSGVSMTFRIYSPQHRQAFEEWLAKHKK